MEETPSSHMAIQPFPVFRPETIKSEEMEDIAVLKGRLFRENMNPKLPRRQVLNKCEDCPQMFLSVVMLRKHRVSEHGDKPKNKCDICEAVLSSKQSLQRHMDSHNNVQPYQCKLCSQSFTHEVSMVRHIRYKHTKERPHKCPVCNYTAVEHSKLQVPEASAAARADIRESLILQLKRQLDDEKAKARQLQVDLQKAMQSNSFGIDRFKGNPTDFNFYTGLPDYLTFLSLCDFLQPERHRISSLYYSYKTMDPTYVTMRGREPILGVQDQLFLVLCSYRQGYKELDLSHRFNISTYTVSEIFSKWTKHMAHVLGQLPIWASRNVIDKNMPQSFKDLNYENTRIIIDCTEMFIQQPSSNLVLQSVLFSTYKNHHTAKGLVGIAPHGPITFASDLYVGSASDYDITKDCGILKLLQPNDHIMADKGFEIQKLLDDINVRVDHPPILRGVTQMSEQQETETRRIARLRIHVERAIERVKNFRILQESFQYSQWRLLNDIWKTCTKLTLFQAPLIEDN